MRKDTVIEMKGVIKKFGDRLIVNGVDLDIHKGECFGILGPNGAGKTTTMKMIYGTHLISSGEIYVLGLNAKKSIREIKSRIGIVPQEDGLDADFTVRENLELYASYHDIDEPIAHNRIDDLLRMMKLEDYAHKFVQTLSGGMRRRLALARGMVNNPQLIILDEPTVGLDPQARMWIWDFLGKFKSQMGTVVMTTHYMEEAEKICDRVAIMDKGKILTIGSPEKIIEDEIGTEVVEFEFSSSEMGYYINRLEQAHYSCHVIHQQLHVHLKKDQPSKDVFNLVSAQKTTVRKANLSDVFLKLAGHDFRDEPL